MQPITGKYTEGFRQIEKHLRDMGRLNVWIDELEVLAVEGEGGGPWMSKGWRERMTNMNTWLEQARMKLGGSAEAYAKAFHKFEMHKVDRFLLDTAEAAAREEGAARARQDIEKWKKGGMRHAPQFTGIFR